MAPHRCYVTSPLWSMMMLLQLLPFILNAEAAFVAPQLAHRSFSTSTGIKRSPASYFRNSEPLYLLGSDVEKGKEEVLSIYPKLGSSDKEYESLSEYIRQWSKQFEPGGIRLTTPCKVVPYSSDEKPEDENVAKEQGVKIMFLKTDTGYKSKKEEKASESGGDAEDAPKKPKKPKKEGGVAILVEMLNTDEVRVVSKRCDVDEDTMIKEMSEEKINSELKKAINVWKKKD